MKKMKNNSMLVHLYDIAFLEKDILMDVPQSIHEKVYRINSFVVDESNAFKFITCSDPEEISFLQRQDFIIDYDKYGSMSLDDLNRELVEITIEINKIVEVLNNTGKETTGQNREITNSYRKLVHKYNSVTTMYNAKRGIQHTRNTPLKSLFKRAHKI